MSTLLGFLPRTYEKMERIPYLFEHRIHYEPLHPESLWVVNSKGEWIGVEASKMRKAEMVVTRSAYVQCVPHLDPEANLLVHLFGISRHVTMKAAYKAHGDGCIVVSREPQQHTTQVHPKYPLPGYMVVSPLLAHGYSNVVMTPHGLYYAGVCIDPQKYISFVED